MLRWSYWTRYDFVYSIITRELPQIYSRIRVGFGLFVQLKYCSKEFIYIHKYSSRYFIDYNWLSTKRRVLSHWIILSTVPTHCIKHHCNQFVAAACLVFQSAYHIKALCFCENSQNFSVFRIFQSFQNFFRYRQNFNDNVLHRKWRMERWHPSLFTYVPLEFQNFWSSRKIKID